jgi:[acyl-carrier-protein] S-malonyltransferase
MGADLASRCRGCRALFDGAGEIVGYPLLRLMTEGPEHELRRTQVAQPALLVLAVAQGMHLRAGGVAFDTLVGHSVGQYAALVLARAMRFEDAVELVGERGRLMQEVVPEGVGAMAAISGLSRSEVASACEGARSVGIVEVACHNAPTQTVISGETAAVEAAMTLCLDEGAGAARLAVTVPFHSSLLGPMIPAFEALVDALPLQAPTVAVIDNVTATALETPSSIRTSLVAHVRAPVLFEESVRLVRSSGVRRFVGCGPGKKGILGLARKIAPDAELVPYDEMHAATSEVDHDQALRG